MADDKRRPAKRHKPAPKLDWEELASAPNLGGMLSFLETPPEIARQRYEAATAVTRAPDTGAPGAGAPAPVPVTNAPALLASDAGAPVLTASTVVPPEIGAPVESASVESPEAGAPGAGAPESGAPETREASYIFRPAVLTPRPCADASDGHTHGEELLYKTMWTLARPFGDSGCRRLIIGARTLSRQVASGMAYSNVQLNLDSLQEKLSIECRGRASGHNDGMDYLVYDAGSIEERRRKAGMTHVVKKGRAVILTTASGAPVAGAPATRSGAPVSGR